MTTFTSLIITLLFAVSFLRGGQSESMLELLGHLCVPVGNHGQGPKVPLREEPKQGCGLATRVARPGGC